MHPVEPSTIVRGPEALTISFITSADSQPWQVRWPDVKYSSIATFLTPLKGSRICVALANVSAMSSLLMVIRGRPAIGFWRRLPGRGGSVAHVRRPADVLERHLPAP